MKDYVFTGRAWTITDNQNRLIPDIDTDQIFHNAHLHITDINEMGQYAFGNLDGWKDFHTKAKPGDVVIVGPNFGSGSSRQHAVDCFKALGVKLIIAVSFGAIYKRNAINSGFPIMIFKDAEKVISENKISNLDGVKVDLLSGELTNRESGETFQLMPFSKVQKDIYDSGSLLNI
ncbi:MAG: 3-isopropylmalate dehydratase [Candidatus Aminicenantes bacterium]|nr:3-isopropylmalate dehydratase [Candidatus Aminicenantes bacterium]NIM81440.1 3-isopropylmalate dehydratase [Candidatus Aminicenantes bacterium]NIN23165.1 3-isopropylmalate dehydratase [Candidatus Aminicenantes bacterium]NIN44626.1 3-isopropylmalate dehydratase [Candidatus Aminicenantes bacterium]NIN87442.1 3-isopropylmalate dehydratase [Candidatus Aminicenantes bacterium]